MITWINRVEPTLIRFEHVVPSFYLVSIPFSSFSNPFPMRRSVELKIYSIFFLGNVSEASPRASSKTRGMFVECFTIVFYFFLIDTPPPTHTPFFSYFLTNPSSPLTFFSLSSTSSWPFLCRKILESSSVGGAHCWPTGAVDGRAQHHAGPPVNGNPLRTVRYRTFFHNVNNDEVDRVFLGRNEQKKNGQLFIPPPQTR